jgi:hypothetical protein
MRLREIKYYSYWHCSDIGDIKILHPHYASNVDDEVVFVAIHPAVAVAMSGGWTDEDFYFGHKGGNPNSHLTMKELHAGAYRQYFSNPVYLYEVDGHDFHSHKNIQDFELITKHSVRVIDEEIVDNPLEFLEQSRIIKLYKL